MTLRGRGFVWTASGLLLWSSAGCSSEGIDHAAIGGAGGGGLEAGQCLSQNDCVAEESCLLPGQSNCGVCFGETECATDEGCHSLGEHYICAASTSSCACPEATSCVAGCQGDEDCPGESTCGASHRCVGPECSGDEQCGLNHMCHDGDCVRTPCTDSAPCDGYCVKGACHSSPGHCEPMAA